jgi:hypothetical protein
LSGSGSNFLWFSFPLTEIQTVEAILTKKRKELDTVTAVLSIKRNEYDVESAENRRIKRELVEMKEEESHLRELIGQLESKLRALRK